jgi:hypothetical protein
MVIIGGMLRDFGVLGIENFKSDVDLVIQTDDKQRESAPCEWLSA